MRLEGFKALNFKFDFSRLVNDFRDAIGTHATYTCTVHRTLVRFWHISVVMEPPNPASPLRRRIAVDRPRPRRPTGKLGAKRLVAQEMPSSEFYKIKQHRDTNRDLIIPLYNLRNRMC